MQPLFVFDGRKLSAKSPEHGRRDLSRQRAQMELEQHSEELRELTSRRARGDYDGSDGDFKTESATARRKQRRAAQRAVKVTEQMCERVMLALSQMVGVNVMRAPYEARWQHPPNPHPHPNTHSATLEGSSLLFYLPA